LKNTTGSSNTFIGNDAGFNNDTGHDNIFIGVSAGNNNKGSYNSFIGTGAGYNNASGTYNVFMGYRAGYAETGSNKLYIDNCYNGGDCDTPLVKGDFSARTLEFNGRVTMTAVASPSDIRYKRNIEPLRSSLESVKNLKGVSYEWRSDEYPDIGFGRGRDLGLIAQDVERVLPEIVHTDSRGYKALSYDKLAPVLVEAIKEQQQIIAEQARTISGQQAAIRELQERLARLEAPARR
jgi:hypothetical protein